MALSINTKRLQEDIEALSQIGRGKNQGIYRPAFSQADMAARAWLKQRILDANLTVHQDEAANIHARLSGSSPEQAHVITGSHIDSVPGGGHLDGVLGVLAGLECLRILKENNIDLKRSLECIAFSDEEGRFGGLFGSSALCGQLTPETIHNSKDLSGKSISEAMAEHDLDAMDALKAARSSDTMHAFIELHIEQGPVLERKQLHLGVVDVINGLVKWNIKLHGEAAHAGAAPMDMRQDAFQGMAEFGIALNQILEQVGSDRSVATIGRVVLSPGAANVVPRLAEFSLDVRDSDPEVLKKLMDTIHRYLSEMSRRRGLIFEFEELSNIEPVNNDPRLCSLIDTISSDLGINHTRMASGAAHDTQIMATRTRTGLIFVPSKGGKSHTPAEWTDWQDIFNGANVLLNTLLTLANE